MNPLFPAAVAALVSVVTVGAVVKSGHAPDWMLPAVSGETATVHTVSWFREHPADRDRIFSACRDNPGQGRHDPNCINAEHANF